MAGPAEASVPKAPDQVAIGSDVVEPVEGDRPFLDAPVTFEVQLAGACVGTDRPDQVRMARDILQGEGRGAAIVLPRIVERAGMIVQEVAGVSVGWVRPGKGAGAAPCRSTSTIAATPIGAPVSPTTIAWVWVTVAATWGAAKLVPSTPATGTSSPSASTATLGPIVAEEGGRAGAVVGTDGDHVGGSLAGKSGRSIVPGRPSLPADATHSVPRAARSAISSA